MKILYELGGRGYKGVLSSVLVHLLAFVGFQFLERETQRTRARKKLAAIFVSNYIVWFSFLSSGEE